MIITLQDADIRAATIGHLEALGFSPDAYEIEIDFTKARKTGLLSAEVILDAKQKSTAPVVKDSPLNFSDED